MLVYVSCASTFHHLSFLINLHHPVKSCPLSYCSVFGITDDIKPVVKSVLTPFDDVWSDVLGLSVRQCTSMSLFYYHFLEGSGSPNLNMTCL